MVAIAAAYATLAFAAAVALAAAARRIESAQLRTFGVTARDSMVLLLAEHGPVVALAFAAGTAAGLALFVVLRDALGFGALLGSTASVSLQVDPIHVVVLGVVLAAIATVALGLGVALERSAALAGALRRPAE